MIAHLSDAKSLISELEEKARKIDAALIAGKPSLAPPPRKGGKSRK
jgi:hypothetical protein